MNQEVIDQQYMERAIALAERGRGYTSPNPLVGCVVVKDGKIIGEGWHKRYGEYHAESSPVGFNPEQQLERLFMSL